MDEILTSITALCLRGTETIGEKTRQLEWQLESNLSGVPQLKATAIFSNERFWQIRLIADGEEVYLYDGIVRRQVAGAWQQIVVGVAKALKA